ncbi:MAG: DUF2442 domain-containing protein [Chitinispirillia bacterium]|nr:DUF2442 domain-containing protein [Chitinispirillia bacterium]MCL2241780.1 DUF2442 domain-containing protein [Chitinispirillia bacterium]
MLPRVINAELRGDYSVYVEFNDGTSGILDFKDSFEHDQRDFVRNLLDKELFKTVKVDLNTLSWANEMDICPDVLYEQLKKAPNGRVRYQSPAMQNMAV